MLARRIIPCLDVKDGRTVKGTRFLELKDAGDPVLLAQHYAAQGADELVLLDISATNEKRKTFSALVRSVAEVCTIPFTVGGGIGSIDDVKILLESGADKVTVNSAAVSNPALLDQLAKEFGSQCIVVAIDGKIKDKKWVVHTHGGMNPTPKDLVSWAREAEQRGAGEILFTSMDHDGTKKGFASETVKMLGEELGVPVIASGGAGSMEDFADVFLEGNADGALAASVFHYGEINIPQLKNFLRSKNVNVRK